MKAFLSHSSADKEFVKAIAKELGRQFCVYDEQSFASGIEFKKSIENGLEESDVFVLFASKSSLSSDWVNFEVEEAWYKKLQKNINQSLTYIIDSSVDYDNIPKWLQRGKIEKTNTPKAVARDIRHHLDNIMYEKQYRVFVGRLDDIDSLENCLTPIGSPPPHSVFISGLPGIGRRSLIRKKIPDILSLRKQVEINVKDGDSMNDLCVRVADLVEPYSTQKGFTEIVKNIQKLSFESARDRLLDNIRKLVQSGELPIFVDEGGLLDSEGFIQKPIRAILQMLTSSDEAYLFFVSERKPHFDSSTPVPVIHLRPMIQEDTKRLLSRLATNNEIEITPEEISELSEYVAGYPPAAKFSIHQAKEYGLELILRDKSRLTEFLTVVFLRHLEKYELKSQEKYFLQILTTYSPLPIPAIAHILDVDGFALSDMLIKLIDLALIVVTDTGYYRISDPVSDAALNAFGYPSEEDHQKVATAISNYIKNFDVDGPRSELSGVLYRAAVLARDDMLINTSVHLASDLVDITESMYHQRRYADAIKIGYQMISERPDNVSGRSYLIRSLIQEERWDEAERQIKELQKYAPLKESSFLKGFLERKKGNLKDAINAYLDSKKGGRGGAALYRELAFCHLILTDYDQAAKYIDEALSRHGGNRYVVDLWAQISAKRGDEVSARQALDRLSAIGDPLFYYHRLSMVEMAFGNPQKARDAASEAYHQTDNPPFEVISHLAYCDIEINNLDEASELLVRLDKDFRNVRRDIRIGLRCRLEIARKHYSNALSQSERILDKKTPIYRALRRDALIGELSESALADKTRIEYMRELGVLTKEMEGLSDDVFMSAEMDPLF
jgi:tetratricopeptide (TPR) repeat protein